MNDKLEPSDEVAKVMAHSWGQCGYDFNSCTCWIRGMEVLKNEVRRLATNLNRRALPDLAKVKAEAKAEAFEEAHDFVAALGRSDGCAKIKFTAAALRKEAAQNHKGE